MGRRAALGFIGVVVVAIACATAAVELPDSGTQPTDAATDNAACPQYNLATDPHHCGSCANACSSTQLCSNGACKSSCDTTLTQCTGDAGLMCADLTSDKNHCGQCTTVCSTADAGSMAPGTDNPDPGIFDGGYDGGPGWDLGSPGCTKSACGITCPTSMTLCSDDICYDTQNHHDHCGACATACTALTQWCDLGHCCSTGSAWCTSACADVASDPSNCGGCGNVCDGGYCSGGVCGTACSAIAGPALSSNINGWPNAGMRFKALVNTTLTSFVVNNQGLADTVNLTTTSGTVLQTLALPASSTTYTATVSWALTAGTSYDLVLVGTANGKYAAYTSYPLSSTGIEIDAMVNTAQTLSLIYWFTFTNFKTCP